jgi:uncharacterized protein YkwD
MKGVMFFLPIIFAVITSCTKESVSPGIDDPVPLTVNKTVLLQLVNDTRTKGCNCGETYYVPVPALTWNNQLEKAAYNHSNDMYRKKYFGHTGSDGSGSGERISAVGYNWKYYAENIAAGYQTEKEVISGWLSSPGHCANIMNGNYKEMGVARAGDYWTQDFGSR